MFSRERIVVWPAVGGDVIQVTSRGLADIRPTVSKARPALRRSVKGAQILGVAMSKTQVGNSMPTLAPTSPWLRSTTGPPPNLR